MCVCVCVYIHFGAILRVIRNVLYALANSNLRSPNVCVCTCVHVFWCEAARRVERAVGARQFNFQVCVYVCLGGWVVVCVSVCVCAFLCAKSRVAWNMLWALANSTLKFLCVYESVHV